MQLSTQDREQKHRTQNIDGTDFPTSTIDVLELSDRKIEELSHNIQSKHLETIAILYFGIVLETIYNLKLIRRNDSIGLNRDKQRYTGSVEEHKPRN